MKKETRKYISVDDFIENQEPQYQVLLESLRNIILSSHIKMRERILFNTPMFSVKKELCYIGTIKKNIGIEIGFHRGFQLSNEQGLLDQKNRTTISGVTFKNIEDLNEKAEKFMEIIQEAIILDEIHEKSIFSEILNKGRQKKKI